MTGTFAGPCYSSFLEFRQSGRAELLGRQETLT